MSTLQSLAVFGGTLLGYLLILGMIIWVIVKRRRAHGAAAEVRRVKQYEDDMAWLEERAAEDRRVAARRRLKRARYERSAR